jgi:hypothetical protein
MTEYRLTQVVMKYHTAEKKESRTPNKESSVLEY